jgi:hypothetical protein
MSPAFLEAFYRVFSKFTSWIDENPYIHGIPTSRLLTSMALGESPEKGVCQGIFA